VLFRIETALKNALPMLGKAFFVEKVADCGASEQFLWRGLAVQSPAGALWGV